MKNATHKFDFVGRAVTLFKRKGSPAWYVEFTTNGRRHRKALGEDLQQAEALAKEVIAAAQAGLLAGRSAASKLGELRHSIEFFQGAEGGSWAVRIQTVSPTLGRATFTCEIPSALEGDAWRAVARLIPTFAMTLPQEPKPNHE